MYHSRVVTQTNRDTGFLEFVGKNILAWNEAEKQKITSAVQGIQTELEALSLPFPKKVFIVKTTGNEEGGAAYTRANAIVFPKADLKAPIAKVQEVICHELFHIMSRANPELRERVTVAESRYDIKSSRRAADRTFEKGERARGVRLFVVPRETFDLKTRDVAVDTIAERFTTHAYDLIDQFREQRK